MIKAHEIQGVLRAGEQLQPRRPRSRAAGPRRHHGGRDRDARRQQRQSHQRGVATPGSTAARCAPTATRPTPARARAGPPATPPAAACAWRSIALQGRDGLPVGADRQDLGLLRRAVQGQGRSTFEPAASAATSWRTCCSRFSFPAEFHAQTAVECAMQLHPQVDGPARRGRRIEIETQEAGVRIIDKTGPLDNPADRDHCLQYMVGRPADLRPPDRRPTTRTRSPRDPRIDALRERMEVRENPQFTRDYLDPDKRSIGNAVQVFFDDGSATERGGDRLPHRPSPAACRRHPGAGAEVRGRAGRAVPAPAGRADPRPWSTTSPASRPRRSMNSWTCWRFDRHGSAGPAAGPGTGSRGAFPALQARGAHAGRFALPLPEAEQVVRKRLVNRFRLYLPAPRVPAGPVRAVQKNRRCR